MSASLWRLVPALPLATAISVPVDPGVTIALCGGGHIVIPLPGSPKREPCPGACHAIGCERRRIAAGPQEDP